MSKRLVRSLSFRLGSISAAPLIFLLRFYQIIVSPLLAPRCRFHPSCSEYAITAFKTHSFFKAIFLIIKRLGRCHPGHPGGVDQVPSS